jgi:hypothetical protein
MRRESETIRAGQLRCRPPTFTCPRQRKHGEWTETPHIAVRLPLATSNTILSRATILARHESESRFGRPEMDVGGLGTPASVEAQLSSGLAVNAKKISADDRDFVEIVLGR